MDICKFKYPKGETSAAILFLLFAQYVQTLVKVCWYKEEGFN